MRRVMALVLAQALVALSTMGSSLHVHEYVGHDHPDHHHGPANHGHEHSPTADRDHHGSDHHAIADDDHGSTIEAESCDPGRHAVDVAMVCTYVPQVHVDVAELPSPGINVPSAPVRSATSVADVRVHGPPFAARIPPRAPPASPHA